MCGLGLKGLLLGLGSLESLSGRRLLRRDDGLGVDLLIKKLFVGSEFIVFDLRLVCYCKQMTDNKTRRSHMKY